MREAEEKKWRISVVTPTLRRPEEVRELLKNISAQELLPVELILVDGAPDGEDTTKVVVEGARESLPFDLRHIRRQGGTAVQRNAGIDAATGDLIAFIDDDVRLDRNFLTTIATVFSNDEHLNVGGVVGYRTNRQFDAEGSQRWRWYRRLRLLTIYEPGRYDFACGYPVNNNLQPRFAGTREVDFMTTACAVWRREVFDLGLRFDPFFSNYGVLEDAHLSLRAGKQWKLLQSGDAHCIEMHSPNGREDRRKIGYKSVINYYYVFNDVAGPLSFGQRFRFWRFQAFEFLRIVISAVRRRRLDDVRDLSGRVQAIVGLLSRRRREFVTSGKS
ncbi:MAG TPA: glycosyltransferase family 2 protein [Pyrinomonadaceae bacterium]